MMSDTNIIPKACESSESHAGIEVLLTPIFRTGSLIRFMGRSGFLVLTWNRLFDKTKFVELIEKDLLLYIDSVCIDGDCYFSNYDVKMYDVMRRFNTRQFVTRQILSKDRNGKETSNIIFHRFLFKEQMICVLDKITNLDKDFAYASSRQD